MRFRIPLVALAAMLAVGALAQDRLVPVRDALDGVETNYRADLRRVFAAAFGADVRLRAMVQPSLGTEYAVGLRQDGERYEIFALQPSRSVWTYQLIVLYRSGHAGVMAFNDIGGSDEGSDETANAIGELEDGLPANPADLPLSRCAIAVDGQVAAALLAAWRRSLGEVRPGDALETGADGTSYQFSTELGDRALSGATWSPEGRTRPARLARLAEAMRDYCQTRAAGRLRAIMSLARQLA